MLLQIHRSLQTKDQLFFTQVLFGVLLFPKSCLNVGGAAYTRVWLIHESLRYSFIEKIFYKSLVHGAPPDSMTKLRKQTINKLVIIRCKTNLLQEKNKLAGSFCVSVYSRIKIKPVAETRPHYFLWST